MPHFILTQCEVSITVIPIFQMQKLRLKARRWQMQDQNLPCRIAISYAHEVDEITAVQSGPGHTASVGRTELQLYKH